MLARDLQREQKMPSQVSLMSPILVGLDGVRRMGKSLGNYIGISEPAYDMMKKFMQVQGTRRKRSRRSRSWSLPNTTIRKRPKKRRNGGSAKSVRERCRRTFHRSQSRGRN
jgi:tyrosyl-tRNA synthetase